MTSAVGGRDSTPGGDHPPVRYGIIGTGMMGCEHILNLMAIDDARVVAVSDPNQTSRDWAVDCAGREPDLAVFSDYRDLLALDDLDAVVVATPNVTHVDVLADVLATGLAVMVEKPLCTTVADCLRVKGLADRRWVERRAMTWVALEYRYMPTVSRFVTASQSGVLGSIKMISIREHRFPFLDKVDNWNRFSANTGGTLVEKCCHFFDLMNLVVDARPVRVYASGGQDVNHLTEEFARPDGTMGRSDVLDNAFVIIDYANGARGSLDLCMFAEGGRYEQELVAVGDRAKIETSVPGDSVRVGPRDGGSIDIPAPLAADVTYEGFHHGSSYREHQEFIAALRSGRPPSVGVDDGVWSVAVGAAAHHSIERGRPVLISEFGL